MLEPEELHAVSHRSFGRPSSTAHVVICRSGPAYKVSDLVAGSGTAAEQASVKLPIFNRGFESFGEIGG